MAGQDIDDIEWLRVDLEKFKTSAVLAITVMAHQGFHFVTLRKKCLSNKVVMDNLDSIAQLYAYRGTVVKNIRAKATEKLRKLLTLLGTHLNFNKDPRQLERGDLTITRVAQVFPVRTAAAVAIQGRQVLPAGTHPNLPAYLKSFAAPSICPATLWDAWRAWAADAAVVLNHELYSKDKAGFAEMMKKSEKLQQVAYENDYYSEEKRSEIYTYLAALNRADV